MYFCLDGWQHLQCDSLVAENVVAGGDVLGDAYEPAEIVGDEDIGGPGLAGGVEAGCVDLEEFKGGRVDLLAGGALTAREVVNHRALVGVGPSVPLKADAVASSHLNVSTARRARLVADDVCVTE